MLPEKQRMLHLSKNMTEHRKDGYPTAFNLYLNRKNDSRQLSTVYQQNIESPGISVDTTLRGRAEISNMVGNTDLMTPTIAIQTPYQGQVTQ